MQNLRKQLPPLTALVVFEAAARHLSFTRAAMELNITQAAVSRQIRSLENNLGVALFTRLHRQIELTGEGRTLFRTVTISLEYLAETVAELRGIEPDSHITVITTHAVASFWLIPRLAKFREAFPDSEVRVLATDQEIEQVTDSFDVGICYGSGHWPGLKLQRLGQPEIFPVCSPDYLAKHPFSTLDELLDETLLHQDDFRWDWIDWPIWLAEIGVQGKTAKKSLKMNSYPLLIQAALAGQGVALGWQYLVDDLLASGSLVKPVDTALLSRHSFFLATPENKPTSNKPTSNKPTPARVQDFCRWIADEFGR